MLLLVTKEIGESYLLACWHKNQFGVAGLCSIKAKPGWQLERQKRHPYQHALPRTKTLVYQLKHFKVKVLASKIYSSLLPKERFTVPPSILTDLLGLSAARLTAALVPCRAYSSHLLGSHPPFLNRRLVYAVDLKQVSWRKLVWWLLICCKLSNSHNYESILDTKKTDMAWEIHCSKWTPFKVSNIHCTLWSCWVLVGIEAITFQVYLLRMKQSFILKFSCSDILHNLMSHSTACRCRENLMSVFLAMNPLNFFSPAGSLMRFVTM